jgi:hypothetical protein
MTRHPWKTGGILGSLGGLLVAAAVMYVAWQHNPQGEIHDELGIDWPYWILLGFVWFVPATVIISVVSGGALAIVGYLRGEDVA